MGRLLEIVTPLHKATKRDYLARMNDDKVHCMVKAKEYEFDILLGCLHNLRLFELETAVTEIIQKSRRSTGLDRRLPPRR
jgi:hypothetical protein